MIRFRWWRGEHATTGADQTPGPRRVTLSSEGRPLLAVSGSSWEPACCVVACHLDCVWSLAIAVVQRTEAVCRASVLLSQVLVEAGSDRPFISTGLLRQQRHIAIRKCLAGTQSAYQMQQRLRYVRGWTLLFHGDRRAAATPYGDRGPGRGQHVTEGTVPDSTGMTSSDVNNEGSQDCRREVSAQEGDVPSARSELDVLNRHPEKRRGSSRNTSLRRIPHTACLHTTS